MTDKEIVEFRDYLAERLIPDLAESGFIATADDFTTCIEIIDDYRQATRRALDQLYKCGYKGPKQIARAIITLEAIRGKEEAPQESHSDAPLSSGGEQVVV